MDLLSEVNKIDRMTHEEIKSYITEKAANVIKTFTDIYMNTSMFQDINYSPEELFVALCQTCIAANRRIDKEEFEMLKSLLGDYYEFMNYNDFKKEIAKADILRLAEIVDNFTDAIGKTMVKAKENIVSFAVGFIALDGNMSDGELSFINKLAS